MKSLIVTILGVATLGLMAFTNPKMADYEQFIRKEIINDTKKSDDLSQALGLLFGGIASSLATSATVRSDYVFLSIYDTTFGEDHVRVLGALNNFFVLTKSNVERYFPHQVTTTSNRQDKSDVLQATTVDRIEYSSATSTQWPPIDIDRFGSQMTWDVIQKTERPRFIQLLGNDYLELYDAITVGGGVVRKRDFLVGDGCKAHACDDTQGIFAIDGRSGRVYAMVIHRGSKKIKAWGIDQKEGFPHPIFEWLASNGLNVAGLKVQ